MAEDSRQKETTATKARQGEGSGRVSAVLIISLVLATLAAIVILGYFLS